MTMGWLVHVEQCAISVDEIAQARPHDVAFRWWQAADECANIHLLGWSG